MKLPPAGRGTKALYKASALTSDSSSVKQGRWLWERLTHVVVLTEQMRQQKDIAWSDMLNRKRYGTLTQSDYKLIASRFQAAPKPGATFVVGRDPLRTDFNNKAVIAEARRLRQTILVCQATDREKLPGRDNTRPLKWKLKQRTLLMQETGERGGGNLPGYLPLLPGNTTYRTKAKEFFS
jgi:hypothetical protein